MSRERRKRAVDIIAAAVGRGALSEALGTSNRSVARWVSSGDPLPPETPRARAQRAQALAIHGEPVTWARVVDAARQLDVREVVDEALSAPEDAPCATARG